MPRRRSECAAGPPKSPASRTNVMRTTTLGATAGSISAVDSVKPPLSKVQQPRAYCRRAVPTGGVAGSAA